MDSKKQEVEIISRVNKLKQKAGVVGGIVDGVIDSKGIERAQAMIQEKEAEYPGEVKKALETLQGSWSAFQLAKGAEQAEVLGDIYHAANNIKDLTSMYKHDLMSHFSLSLREFCEKIDAEKKEHHIIVQAHVNVMLVTFQEQLRSDKSDKAEELKKVVQIAIQKYS